MRGPSGRSAQGDGGEGIALDLDTEDTVIGQPTRMDYSIHVEPVNPWNWLAGGNWSINKRWSVAGEFGFGGARSKVLVTGFYRF